MDHFSERVLLVKHVQLAIKLSDEAGMSMIAKIVRSLRDAIHEGSLKQGDVLPPSRTLAKNLGTARGTVVAAYEQLIAEGYLEAKQGSGTVVHPDIAHFRELQLKTKSAQKLAKHDLPSARKSEPKHLRDERDPEQQLGDLTKRPAWRQSWRNASNSAELEYELPVQGSPRLLEEISEHLRVMRATHRDPQDILVTGGAREGLGLLLTALGTTIGKRIIIGIEAGGVQTLGAVAKQHGAEVVMLPVDQHGLLVDAIPNSLLDAVIVTPSYQYPQGEALPLRRRRQLIEWAKHNGAIIIEDDFDSELRFLRSPLPTLAALDNPETGVVATLGSFSSTLSLSVAAGFLILPNNIHTQILTVRNNLGCPVSPILQIALAELLASGELRRHVARLRRIRARADRY